MLRWDQLDLFSTPTSSKTTSSSSHASARSTHLEMRDGLGIRMGIKTGGEHVKHTPLSHYLITGFMQSQVSYDISAMSAGNQDGVWNRYEWTIPRLMLMADLSKALHSIPDS